MFCVRYFPNKDYKDVDELIFRCWGNDLNPEIEDVLKKYPEKTIIIDIVAFNYNDIDMKALASLYKKYGNLKLMFRADDFKTLKDVKENKIPYFFWDSANSIDQVYGLMELEPTDIYICEDLGFSLDKVSKILHDRGIRVRVYPNICQSSWKYTPSLKKFFIRPEDIIAYRNFVDVFELVGDEDRLEIIIKVYKEGKWFGPIKEIIPSFYDDLNSRYVLSNFGVIRSRCRKRCLFNPGSCNICERFKDVAETLQENKIAIKRKTT